MARAEAPTYMVYIGQSERVKADPMDRLAMYAISGFTGERSRYDQVIDAMEELDLTAGREADDIEMRLMPQEEVDFLRRNQSRPRQTTASGLTAEVIGQPGEEGQWNSTYYADPSPPGFPIPQSLLQ